MKNIICKDNSLVNASYSLSLVEQRLVLLAILEIRKPLDQRRHPKELWIYAEDYIKHFKTHRNTAYQALKEAAKTLFSRQFTYKVVIDGKTIIKTSRWVTEVGYSTNHAFVSIVFSEAIKPLISELERRFTYYEIEQIANLGSGHAVRLYELLIAWRSTGKTPVFELEQFRQQLGLGVDEYQTMSDFKKRVLDVALKQINEHTNIAVTYQQHKAGRMITGFSFSFKERKAKTGKDKDSAGAKKPRKPVESLRSKLVKEGVSLN